MNVRRLETSDRISQAVTHNGIVYVAGQVATDAPDAPIDEQTQSVLKRLDSILASAGSDRSKLLSATVWLSDVTKISDFNREWEAWIPRGCAPARACVEARLAVPHYAVEVAVVAAL